MQDENNKNEENKTYYFQDNKKEIDSRDDWWQPAVFMFLKVSGWMTFPLIAALFLGKWLDQKLNTEPWLLVFCAGIAFLIFMYGLIKNAQKEFKRLGKEERERRKEEYKY